MPRENSGVHVDSETLTFRAPDYIKAAASLIAAHGWCNSTPGPVPSQSPTGLNLVRAVIWAVADRRCAPRDLTTCEHERVDEVLDHLEAERGLNMPVSEYERKFAAASAENIAWELTIAAWRYEDLITPRRSFVPRARV